jgi:hypothetical protein
MLKDKDDFTEKNYIKIIRKIDSKSIFFNEIYKKKSFILWRHDVDFSPQRALSLAKIESKHKVKSTYFVMLTSMFYNIFEKEIRKIFLEILSLGHQLALHFDVSQYNIKSKKELEKLLNYEKKILEVLFKTNIKVFSFHNPTNKILKYDSFRYAKMINAYSKYFRNNVKYCSDSNGYWRHQRISDFLDEKHKKSQIATHPAWWTRKAIEPNQRIKRCIYGRAKKINKIYKQILKKTKNR